MSKCTINCIRNDNVFAIIGAASHALDLIGESTKIKKMQEKVWKCHSYQEALDTIEEYVHIQYNDESEVNME